MLLRVRLSLHYLARPRVAHLTRALLRALDECAALLASAKGRDLTVAFWPLLVLCLRVRQRPPVEPRARRGGLTQSATSEGDEFKSASNASRAPPLSPAAQSSAPSR